MLASNSVTKRETVNSLKIIFLCLLFYSDARFLVEVDQLVTLICPRSQMQELSATAMSFCLSVRSFVSPSPGKFIKSFARWQHLTANEGLSC